MEDVIDAWHSLPRRIYLDTSTLQTIHEHGETIFEDEPHDPWTPGALTYEGHDDQVRALQSILTINQRAQFEFVITKANLREAISHIHGGSGYRQWVLDVLDTWLVQAAREPSTRMPPAFAEARNVSRKDALLLQDALEYKCDAFLTMETKLESQGDVVERATGLRVLRPTRYWELMEPWARLYM